MLNLLNPNVRKQIIEESNGSENIERKKVSFGQYEVFKDRILQQVKAYLSGFYSKQTIDNTPIVASVNLARRIVMKEASLYTREPERKFYNVTPEQEELLKRIYADMKINTIMQRLNQNFKLQDQAHCYIVPRNGKLKAIPLLSHQLDVVPFTADQEEGEVYLINGFDRITANVRVSERGDSYNELIADEDDYQEARKAIAVWSPMFNFTMNERGDIFPAEDYGNPLGGVVPFVDIFNSKDGEYWVRTGASLTEFTIQYNAALTDLGNIVRMQGFGQGWLKAPQNLMPDNIQVGPNFILRLPIDPNNPTTTDFGFANANADLAGSLAYIEGLLSSFLTSRGVDPKVVNTKGEAVTYSSGVERLLAMIEQFEATEQDTELFEDAENKILQKIIAYVNTYGGSPVLPNYPNLNISPDAYVQVNFKKPEAIQSENEKLNNIQARLELGLITKTEAIAMDRGIDVEMAKEVQSQVTEETGGGVTSNLNGAQMKSISDIVANVALGVIPRESAVKLVSLAFGIDDQAANELMASAGAGFKPTEGVKPMV